MMRNTRDAFFLFLFFFGARKVSRSSTVVKLEFHSARRNTVREYCSPVLSGFLDCVQSLESETVTFRRAI